MKNKNIVGYIVGINIVIFILQQLIKGFTEHLILVSSEIFQRPWILITSMFLHGSLSHLFFNMYALFLFGTLIENKIGSKRFLFVYFVSGIIASFTFSLFRPEATGLGASGAIMSILGLTIILLPNLQVLFFFILPMSMRTAGIIFAIIDIVGLFDTGNGVANSAHLAGLVVGLIYGKMLLKQKKEFNKNFIKISKKTNNSEIMSEDQINDYIKYGRL